MAKHFLGIFEELILLAILKLGNDAYGVPIADAIEEMTGKRVSIGALYISLARLEEKGLLQSRIGEATSERGGRAKKYFSVEEKGIEILRSIQKIHNQVLSESNILPA